MARKDYGSQEKFSAIHAAGARVTPVVTHKEERPDCATMGKSDV